LISSGNLYFLNGQPSLSFAMKLSSALSLFTPRALISQETFLENRGFNGLGISGGNGQRILLENCTFEKNWVSYSGGGVNLDETGIEREVQMRKIVFKGLRGFVYKGGVLEVFYEKILDF
jgi:hypothetical protein